MSIWIDYEGENALQGVVIEVREFAYTNRLTMPCPESKSIARSPYEEPEPRCSAPVLAFETTVARNLGNGNER